MKRGIGTSGGIGIGYAMIINDTSVEVKKEHIQLVEEEVSRYEEAKKTFIQRTTELINNLNGKLGKKESMILQNQIYLVNDQELNSRITDCIKDEKICCEAAIEEACNVLIKLFSSMEDETLAQRAADIEDMKTRILRILMNIEDVNLSELPKDTVIIAKELTPSITAVMDTNHVVGIVTERGGDTSHAAILARALEIPAVLNVRNAMSEIHNKEQVIVDGSYGEVFVNPLGKTLEIYNRKQKCYIEKQLELRKYISRDTLSMDGKKVELVANIGMPEEAAKAIDSGAEGIGLFRTEFLFMNGYTMPTEEEQFEAYKKAAIICKNKPVIIRTLDVGGDKDIPYMGLTKENNPFLGYRAIRYCLDRVDVFTRQLRAILRASAYGDIRIMIPLVTSLSEVVDVKRHIHNISNELDKKEIKYNKNIKLGVMIETPAASLMADVLAKEVDFFSIGTNDLIQYTVAVDRGNENVAYLYSPFNPAVLRSIRHIIQCGHNEGIPVGMCGEAAANPNMIPLLLAFGLDEFSVTASNILETRKNIASWSLEDAKNIMENVMKLWTEKEIVNYLAELEPRQD